MRVSIDNLNNELKNLLNNSGIDENQVISLINNIIGIQEDIIVDDIKYFYKTRKNILKCDKFLIEEDIILRKMFSYY